MKTTGTYRAVKCLWSLLIVICALVQGRGQGMGDLGIIPAPASVDILTDSFGLGPRTRIAYDDPSALPVARMFRDFLSLHYHLDLPLVREKGSGSGSRILFSAAGYADPDTESYRLEVTAGGVRVTGAGPGLFYGLQSLMQLFPLHPAGRLTIPGVKIADHPRYPYRGLMLGESYHFFPVAFVKELLDEMSRYKLNTLHWHLTDDNGWRIEIKRYPRLTEIGAWRKETQIGHDGNAFDSKCYGGYYTQDEIRDIVRYAAERHITIVPEIEMPGHCMAALASYPWLGCTGGPYEVATAWGVYKDIYCPSDSTFEFIEHVLTEVMSLFPSYYIHIGGDEVPKDTWKQSTFCQSLMKKQGLKTEDELQSYFIRRIESFVRSRGREIIGWDEILEGGLAPHATVESWRGTDGGIAAARQGHDVIMAPTDYVYFDYLQGKGDEEPIAIGGFNPLEKVYSFDPTPAALTPAQQKHVLGVEACIWTEFMGTARKVEYMVFPRLLALSEVGWSLPGRKDYQRFLTSRLPAHLAKLDTSDILYRVPEVIGLADTTLHGPQFTFSLMPSVAGGKIYYTLDGYDPDESTLPYDGPLTVRVPEGQKRTVKARVFSPSGKRSPVTTTQIENP